MGYRGKWYIGAFYKYIRVGSCQYISACKLMLYFGVSYDRMGSITGLHATVGELTGERVGFFVS
jgi:hypothetical protein